jgi:hypothetical protein
VSILLLISQGQNWSVEMPQLKQLP